MKRWAWIVVFVSLSLPAHAIAEMAYEKKLARAQNRYAKTWGKAAGYFGAAGKPMPLAAWGHPRNSVHFNAEGMREVGLPPSVVQRLGSRKRARGGGKAARKKTKELQSSRAGAQHGLLHEWAHIYQNPLLLYANKPTEPGARGPVEHAAEGFADTAGRQVLRGKGYRGFIRRNPPRPSEQRWIAKQDPNYIMRGQFGSNWGADPTTIKYPYAPPHHQLRAKRRKVRHR